MSLLLFSGSAIVFFGLKSVLRSHRRLARSRLVIKTPHVAIRETPGGGRVQIQGKIVAGEQGVLLTPFTSRRVVWARIAVEEREGKLWLPVLQAEEGRTFLVDDGSGEQARVNPTSASVLVEREVVAESGFMQRMPFSIEAFLLARGLSSRNAADFNKTMRCVEEVLVEGSHVSVLGPSKRDAGPIIQNGYRSVPSSELVVSRAADPTAALILTTEAGLQHETLAWHFSLATAATAFGAIVAVLAVLVGS